MWREAGMDRKKFSAVSLFHWFTLISERKEGIPTGCGHACFLVNFEEDYSLSRKTDS